MSRRVPVLGQLAHPRGVLAPATSFVLNVVNLPINRWTMSALDVTGSEEILDVGFGGGVGLDLIRRKLTTGRVTGIDISNEMVEAAARRFNNPVRVMRADVAALPFNDGTFDRVYSVNTVFFWPDVRAGIAEIRRVLRPEGRVVIAAPTAAFVLLLGRIAGLWSRSGVKTIQNARRIAEDEGFRDVRVLSRAGASLLVAGG